MKKYPTEWDVWNDIDKERIARGDLKPKEVRHAANQDRGEGHGKYDEDVPERRKEESQVGVLRVDQQGEARKSEVARKEKVKKTVWTQIDGKFKRVTKAMRRQRHSGPQPRKPSHGEAQRGEEPQKTKGEIK